MIEWELTGEGGARTGRWRTRQYYRLPVQLRDTRPPGERTMCDWREGPSPTLTRLVPT